MSRVSYDGRLFRVLHNVTNGESSSETLFRYVQSGSTVSATYEGGGVSHGYLLGTALENGELEFCYMHLSGSGTVRTGRCRSTPTLRPDGTLLVAERWQWTSGDCSHGESTLEEVGRWR